jgi:hypothetical protein
VQAHEARAAHARIPIVSGARNGQVWPKWRTPHHRHRLRVPALSLPDAALVGRAVPKEPLLTRRAARGDKALIRDCLDGLDWVAALKPGNIGAPIFRSPEREYLEIAVLLARVLERLPLKPLAHGDPETQSADVVAKNVGRLRNTRGLPHRPRRLPALRAEPHARR